MWHKQSTYMTCGCLQSRFFTSLLLLDLLIPSCVISPNIWFTNWGQGLCWYFFESSVVPGRHFAHSYSVIAGGPRLYEQWQESAAKGSTLKLAKNAFKSFWWSKIFFISPWTSLQYVRHMRSVLKKIQPLLTQWEWFALMTLM